jgi:hypothetical protein
MFDATVYTFENDSVDWRGLADQIFPADALRTAPTVNFLAVLANS